MRCQLWGVVGKYTVKTCQKLAGETWDARDGTDDEVEKRKQTSRFSRVSVACLWGPLSDVTRTRVRATAQVASEATLARHDRVERGSRKRSLASRPPSTHKTKCDRRGRPQSNHTQHSNLKWLAEWIEKMRHWWDNHFPTASTLVWQEQRGQDGGEGWEGEGVSPLPFPPMEQHHPMRLWECQSLRSSGSEGSSGSLGGEKKGH